MNAELIQAARDALKLAKDVLSADKPAPGWTAAVRECVRRTLAELEEAQAENGAVKPDDWWLSHQPPAHGCLHQDQAGNAARQLVALCRINFRHLSPRMEAELSKAACLSDTARRWARLLEYSSRGHGLRPAWQTERRPISPTSNHSSPTGAEA